MTARLASTYGGVTGFLLGVAVVLIYDMPLLDAGYRVLALSACGAWMGAILVWLDQLLPQNSDDEEASGTES